MTDTTDLDAIDPLHSAILWYCGQLRGYDSHGIWDIEFPTLHQATTWAQDCEIENKVSLRDMPARFDSVVVIQYRTN